MKKDNDEIVTVFDTLESVAKFFEISLSTLKRGKVNNRQYEVTQKKQVYDYEKDCYIDMPTVYEITAIII
jgi:hypothetical protein